MPPPGQAQQGGGGLRVLVLLSAVGCILTSLAGLFFVAGGHDDDSLGPSPLPRRLLILSLCGLLQFGLTTGVWGRRRWGVYGIVVVSMFAFMQNWRIGGVTLAVPCLVAPVALAAFAGLSWHELQ